MGGVLTVLWGTLGLSGPGSGSGFLDRFFFEPLWVSFCDLFFCLASKHTPITSTIRPSEHLSPWSAAWGTPSLVPLCCELLGGLWYPLSVPSCCPFCVLLVSFFVVHVAQEAPVCVMMSSTWYCCKVSHAPDVIHALAPGAPVGCLCVHGQVARGASFWTM